MRAVSMADTSEERRTTMRVPEAAGGFDEADGRIAWLLDHPLVSDWLKEALRHVAAGDPIVVANEIEMLRHVVWLRAGRIDMPKPEAKKWSGREDSNLRPLPPEDSALPG
jgi:hypothetical protein